MTTNDWKAIDEWNSWGRKLIIFQKGKIRYLYVEMDYSVIGMNAWIVAVRTYKDKLIYKRNFSSKLQALKFAKQYMRTH